MTSSQKNKKPKFGNAWKNVKSDPSEMDILFGKFVKQPINTRVEKENISDSTDKPKDSISSKDSPKENLTPDQFDLPKNDQLISDPHDLLPQDKSISNASNQASVNIAPGANSYNESVQIAPGANIALGANNTPALNNSFIIVPDTAGHTSVPNIVLDGLLPKLSTTEQVIYLRLYRLSHGFRSETCKIGFPKLASSCNISRRQAINSIEKLQELGLIQKLGSDLDNKSQHLRGNIYKVNLPLTPGAIIAPGANSTPDAKFAVGAKSAPNKDDDHDDYLNKDHHQSTITHITEHQNRVMMIYQEVTGNLWSKADHTNYEKIKHIPIEKIEVALRLANDRATNRPNSFAFFIKEILASLNPKTQSRSNRKKAMQKIVERVRNASVGSNISPSEFAYKVKETCLREDVSFDNDLLDELMNKA
jgi:DNA-binding Lrp family transcriptional regulator